ncbi:MAG: PHB depolymerase family esterase [Verrucomicrobiota bacterium]
MKNEVSFSLRIVVCLHCLFFLLQETSQGGTQGDYFLWHDGFKRTYVYYIPDHLPADQPIPLVFGLHAGWRNGQRLIEEGMGGPMNDMADQYKFITVYPDGFGQYKWWNDCRDDATLAIGYADDVGFIDKLIRNFSNVYNIDPERIYAWGQSNGGMMCYRLGQELSHKIAAVAGINASQPFYNACPPPVNPISVLIMNGTDDVHLPFEGGFLEGFRSLGRVISAENTAAYWRYYNQTDDQPTVTNFTDYVLDDGPSDVVLKTYVNGNQGTEVAFYQVNGGGHTAPGTGNDYAFKINFFGWTNMDIHGAYQVWSFFDRHRLNGRAPTDTNPVRLSSYWETVFGDWMAGNNESTFWDDEDQVTIGNAVDPTIFLQFEVPELTSLSSIRLKVCSRDSEATDVTRALGLWNKVTETWDEVAGDLVGTNESILEATIGGDLDSYLNPGQDFIYLLIQHEHPSLLHEMSIDQVEIEVVE